MAIPAGAAFIDVKPSFRSFARDLSKGTVSQSKRAGTQMGKSFGDAAHAGASVSLRKLAAEVGKTRDAEATAAGKVRVAEARLNEVRADSKTKASVLARAEETLAKAQRDHSAAQDRATTSAKEYAKAQDRAADKTAEVDKKSRALTRRLDGVRGAFGRARKSAGSFAKSTAGQAAGGLLAVASTDQLFQFGKDAVGRASDLEQSRGGAQAIFGKDAQVIEAASKSAAKNLGLTKNAYNELASTLGAGLKNKGIKDYADQTKTLIGYGADLSAQFGGTTQEAVDALASAMRGEMDPIEKYGVTLNATSIEAEALATGLAKPVKDLDKIKVAQNKAIVAQRDYTEAVKKHGKGSEEALNAEAKLLSAQTRLGKVMDGNKPKLTEQEKAQAALSLITKQTATAHGTFAAEADTLAGKNARLSASWGDVKTSLGEKLLPTVSAGTGHLADFVVGMNEGTGAGGAFADQLGSITGFLTNAWETLSPYKREIALAAAAFGTWKVATSVIGGVTSELRTARDGIRAVRDTASSVKGGFSSFAAGVRGADLDGTSGKAGRLGSAFRTVGTRAKAAGTAVLGAGKSALISAKNFDTLALAKTRAGLAAAGTAVKTLALRAAQLASAAATKTLTVVTRVFNTVLRMNPIGLVVTALIGLGAGLVLAYKKSATFRRVVDTSFAKVKAAGVAVFGWIKNTGLPWARGALQKVGAVVSWLWNRIYKPYFGFIIGRVRGVFGWIKNTGVPWVGRALTAIGSAGRTLWTKWLSPAFSRISGGVRALVGTFRRAKHGIGRVWSGLTSTVSKPVTSALGWLDRNFLSKVRSVLTSIGAGDLAKKIPSFGLVRDGNGPRKTGARSGLQLADGGPVTGWSPHPRADNIPAWLTANEYVLPVAAVKRLTRTVGAAGLEMLRRGRIPGYAIGGKVSGLNPKFLAALHAFNAAAGGRFSVLSGLRSRAEQEVLYRRYLAGTGNLAARPGTSRHESGNAADLTPSSARDTHGALARRFGLHFPVPGEAWHVELAGGAKGGGFGGFLSGLAGRVLGQGKKALDALLAKAPGGFWMQAGVAAMRKVTGSIAEKVSSLFGASQSATSDSRPGAEPGGAVERWRSLVLQALGIVGQPASLANATLRRMMQESGGNPRAINLWDSNARAGIPSKGLMQVIDPTFRAYAHPSHRRDVYDPLSNIVASMRYALSRYGSLAAAYNRPGGYARGTTHAQPGPAWVGEHGPELLWFRGGERVVSHRNSRRLAAGVGDLSLEAHVYIGDRELTDLVDARVEITRRHDARIGGGR